MAERRMFAKTIIDSDMFLDMPLSTQALYFHLSMRADDDGFINNPRKLQRMVGASDDDLKVLIMKRFILPFDSGVVVIKHWKIHNYIRNDRYKETVYKEERAQLEVKENGAYTELSSGCQPSGIPSGYQTVYQMDTQDRVEKDIGSLEVEEDKYIGPAAPTKPVRHRYGRYKNVLLTDDEMDKLKDEFPRDWGDRIERLSEYMASTGKSYKNFLATIRNWAKRDGPQKQVKKGNSFMDLVEDEYE
jgi:hypothetical protein